MPKVLLKDVVARIKDKVDKDNTELEFYIGGEHFDNGEIQITKKGIIKDSTIGPAFHMRFQPGDVLLMSRNPHLRKAGVVNFEGICSDVSYVCRTKDENVLMQRFIPFIFQTDHFWKFAEENKKGSTNFFLNWSDFEKYEFDLPVIEEQRKLCEMMWAFEDTKTAYKQLLQKTDDLVKSQFIEMFGDPIENEKGWRTIPLLETGKCKNGMNYSSKDSGVEMRCLGVADFQDNAVIDDMSVLPTVSLNEKPSDDYLLQDGDIVFVRSNGNKALVGRSVVVYPNDEPVVYSGFCIRYRKNYDELLIDYLLRFFKTDSVRLKMAGRGANIQNLNQQILASLNVPVPSIELQQEFSLFVKQSDKSKFVRFKSQFIEMFGDPYENNMDWPMMRLSVIAKVDGTMTKEYEKYADYPHIGIDSIEKNTGVLSGYRTVKQDNVISPKYYFGPQHILYSKIRPALNKVAVPDFEGLCSADCYPLLPIGGFCERKFLAHVLRSEYFLSYILSFSVRSQMPKVNRKQLEGFTFPCPPIELQRQFVTIIEQSDKSK